MPQKAEPIVFGSNQSEDWKMNSNAYKQDTHLGLLWLISMEGMGQK